MERVELNLNGVTLDYRKANTIAQSVAHLFDKEPSVVAWYDGPNKKMSPVIEGADVVNRWKDYGESHGGNVSISINGDYDFIFADSAEFEEVGPSPYISLHDVQGHEYLCLPEHLRDPKNPQADACLQVEEIGDYGGHGG